MSAFEVLVFTIFGALFAALLRYDWRGAVASWKSGPWSTAGYFALFAWFSWPISIFFAIVITLAYLALRSLGAALF